MTNITLFPVNEAVLQDHFNETGVTDTEMFLYDLLVERPPEANISHKTLPSLEEHVRFVRSLPYDYWYLIQAKEVGRPKINVGSIYLTDRREVGIFLIEEQRGKGYGSTAIYLLRTLHPGQLLANVSPENTASQKFFEEMGAKCIQYTYEICS